MLHLILIDLTSHIYLCQLIRSLTSCDADTGSKDVK